MKWAFVVLIFACAAFAIVRPPAGAWPTVRRVETQTFGLAQSGTVAVQNSSGDVRVEGWEYNRVELTSTKTAWSKEDLDRIRTEVENGPDRFGARAVFPQHCLNCDDSFVLRVPRGAHVTVDSSSGDVNVSSTSGPVRAETASGAIALQRLGGEAHVHSDSGDVNVDGTEATVDAATSSGDISAKNLASDVNLVASSGSVEADFVRCDSLKLVRMVSSSGDLSLSLPRGAGFKIEATTTSGSIDSNLGLPIRDRDSGADVAAQVGDPKFAVQMRSASGDIDIKMR